MSISKADALRRLVALKENLPVTDDEKAIRIAWWTDFMHLIEYIEQVNTELAEHARSVISHLRGERMQWAILTFRWIGTASEMGAEILQKHHDEIEGLMIHMMNSLERGADIVEINSLVIDHGKHSVSYEGGISKAYQQKGLAWRMFARCSMGENHCTPISILGADKSAVEKEANRQNREWRKGASVTLFSIQGDILTLEPAKIST